MMTQTLPVERPQDNSRLDLMADLNQKLAATQALARMMASHEGLMAFQALDDLEQQALMGGVADLAGESMRRLDVMTA